MADEITSTDRRPLYRIELVVQGNEVVVKYVGASSAVMAHQKGIGLAALDDLKVKSATVRRATDEEIEEFYGDTEEE